MKYKILSYQYIEKQATDILLQASNGNITVPVDVELIAETHLGLILDIRPMPDTGLLGYINANDRIISINEQLTEDEKSHGRLRFTVAHEIGHDILHVPQLQSFIQENTDKQDMNTIICRDGSKAMIEKQADRCAAALLMPAFLLEQHLMQMTGITNLPITVRYIMENRHELLPYRPVEHIIQEIMQPILAVRCLLKPIAELFQVSVQAMIIRLLQLKLLVDTNRELGSDNQIRAANF